MDKISALNQIKIALEELLSQTQQLEKGAQPVHQIDKDLLLEKTRALYEQMMALENSREEEKASGHEPAQEEKVPAVEEITETVVKNEDASPEISKEEKQEIHEVNQEETVPEPAEKTETERPAATMEKVAEPVMEEPVEEKTKPVEETKKSVATPKTMLDLFSEAPSEMLGDTLTPTEKPALADSLQMSGIADLREAIGINDKFLFVNELFNGDLERYNKVIDELNGFSGLSGAQTYLTELQVQFQWAEDGSAYQKLNILLERKFA